MKIMKGWIIAVLLVPCTLRAQTTPTTIVYSYTGATYTPNSNLQSYSDSVTGTWAMQYDSLNRLQSAASSSGPYQGLTLSWGYDSFGNRLSQTPSGASNALVPGALTATYDANNHISGGSSGITGQRYDAAGNLQFDGLNWYAYDAENRVCASYSRITAALTKYIYDADGNRVAKLNATAASNFNLNTFTCDMVVSGTVQATYLLGQSGEQVTELDGSGNWKHTNVYAAGQLLATYDQEGSQQLLHFYVGDALGTKRVQTTAGGVVEESCQSLPYGDGLSCTGKGQEASEQHFTGKERDSESGLDYFGARYYGSSMGRFMSPDWAAKAEPVPYAKLDNPQSLNLYAYVGNNPLSRTDPDGHEVDLGNSDKKLRDQAQTRILSNLNKNERGLFTATTDKNGTTKLVLNKDAAAGFEGKHSAAYGMLNQAINAKAVATVTVGDVQTVGTTTYHVQDAGGGKTVPTGNGNVSILLSEHPDPLISQGILPMRGMNGEVVPNPPGIIAGHELLGHGRLEMLGRPYGEGEAIGVENQLRREQGLPLRNPQDY